MKSLFHGFLKLCAGVTVLSFGMPLSASNATDKKTITFGITSQSAPYVLQGDTNKGIDPELLALIARAMGYEPEFVVVPFNRRNWILSDKRADAVTMWTKPDDVPCFVSTPYRYWRNAYFHVTSTQHHTAPHTERIGIYQGSEPLINQLKAIGLKHQELQQIGTISAAVRMMIHGRLDAYIGDYPTVMYSLNTEDDEGHTEVDVAHTFRPTPQRVCFLKKKLRILFDKTLAGIITNQPDALAAIPRSYGLTENITPPLMDPAPAAKPAPKTKGHL